MNLVNFVSYTVCSIVIVFGQRESFNNYHSMKVHQILYPEKNCKAVQHHYRAGNCRLIDTAVHLDAPEDTLIIPNQVTVPRCYSGSRCNSENKCLPTKINKKKFGVRIAHRYNTIKCGWIEVEVHEECKCQCDLSLKECEAQGKIFSLQDCTCKCPEKHEKEKLNCLRKNEMIWDEKLCKCVCTSEIMTCSTGLYWVPEICGCRQLINKFLM